MPNRIRQYSTGPCDSVHSHQTNSSLQSPLGLGLGLVEELGDVDALGETDAEVELLGDWDALGLTDGETDADGL